MIGTGILFQRVQETVRFTTRLGTTRRVDDRTNRDAREKHRRKRYGVVGVRVRGHDTTHTDKQIKTGNAILMRESRQDDDDDDDDDRSESRNLDEHDDDDDDDENNK